MGPNFMVEIECGNLFEHIDDFIEFSLENEDDGGGLTSNSDIKDFLSIWNNALLDTDPIFSDSKQAFCITLEFCIWNCDFKFSF